MNLSPTRLSIFCIAPLFLLGIAAINQPSLASDGSAAECMNHAEKQDEAKVLKVQYLEFVTPSVNETCDALAAAHGVVFSEPIAELGNARTADLADGGRIGVRAPMRATEQPIVRPYVLVDDIQSAVKAAENTGATVALPPMPIPGQGTFSIYILGGIEHGLWQL